MWVTEVLKKIFPLAVDFRGDGQPTPTGIDPRHISPRQVVSLSGKKSFTFVREPLSWHKSYWAMDKTRHAEETKKGLENYFEEKFKKFPEGGLTYFLKQFLGEDLKLIDFVGRQEFLRDDLLSILKETEGEFDEGPIFTTPPRNKPFSQYKMEAVFPGYIKEEIVEREKWVYDHFPYMGEATENEK